MKPTNEEIWQRSSLFAELDALDRGMSSLNPTLPDGTSPLPLSSNCIPRFPPPHSISLPCQNLSSRFTSKVSVTRVDGPNGVKSSHPSYSKTTLPSRNPSESRRLWKPIKTHWKMVLGSDVGLAEVVHLALFGLVGRISYRYLCDIPTQEWVQTHWFPLLGYTL